MNPAPQVLPDSYFLISGSGDSISTLNAFDLSLLNAGIGDLNLVRVSSILPSGCQRIDLVNLPAGSLVPTAFAERTSSLPGDRISAAIAVAIPEDPDLSGLIMEHSDLGSALQTEEHVREMAIAGMKMRNRAVAEVVSVSVEHVVERCGAVVAAVALWWSESRIHTLTTTLAPFAQASPTGLDPRFRNQ